MHYDCPINCTKYRLGPAHQIFKCIFRYCVFSIVRHDAYHNIINYFNAICLSYRYLNNIIVIQLI